MASKAGKWLLADAERKLRDWLVPFVPKGVETYHLTLTTILWCAGILLFSWLALTSSIQWLWGVSAMIFLQYITDLLDGEVGRQRNTGLVKWGFYMDHFLDYLFLCSILGGYAILLPAEFYLEIVLVFALLTAFMVNSFLSFGATQEFHIAYLRIGPTEVRLIFILINTLLIIFGRTHLAFALPYVLVFSALGLAVVVFRTQRRIWALDLEQKALQTPRGPASKTKRANVRKTEGGK